MIANNGSTHLYKRKRQAISTTRFLSPPISLTDRDLNHESPLIFSHLLNRSVLVTLHSG